MTSIFRNSRVEQSTHKKKIKFSRRFINFPFVKRILLIILCIYISIANGEIAKAQSAKYLILHLDAVCSEDFFREFDYGRLPNIAKAFEDGTIIRHGLTLYPGGTEIIYPRLKQGLSNEDFDIVGWSYIDNISGRKLDDIQVFFKMIKHFPKLSRDHFIYGLPGLDFLSGMALQNVPRLLEEYDVLEFFWFNTDTVGHLLGDQYHINSLYRLDKYIGKLLKQDNLDNINLLLYSDHGMITDNVYTVDLESIVKSVVKNHLYIYSCPNIYLKDIFDTEKLEDIAMALSQEDDIDYAFYRRDNHTVVGLNGGAPILISEREGKIKYSYLDKDVFGYYQEGYNGQYLSKEEWLKMTKDNQYPAVPPNIYGYMSNKNTGDIVIVLNPPRIPKTIRANKGNHSGITSRDLMVPILLKGPNLENLENVEELWLNELYISYIPELYKYNSERHKVPYTVNLLTLHSFEQQKYSLEIDKNITGRYNLTIQAIYELNSSISIVYDTSNMIGIQLNLWPEIFHK